MTALSRALAEELEELHPRQLEAVVHAGNVVVKAGPGSGKTRTLVARVAHTLETQLSPFRGVACITYTNAAADEIARRVRRLGVASPDRLACSTLHSFCLREILKPYGPMTGRPVPTAGSVVDEATSVDILQSAFDAAGVSETPAQYRLAHITRIRRDIAVGADLDGFDPREVAAAELYDGRLRELGFFDFESMVIEALGVVEGFPEARDLLRARFPEVAVDEYQDLGRVLHRLILTLRDDAGIQIFAVGDGDQSVFGFAGADPRNLLELEARDDFHPVELEVNFRSGQDIIRASEAALGKSLGRQAVEGALPGTVELRSVSGGLDDHARESADIAADLLAAGTPAERIAVLYPARGPLIDLVLREFSERGIPAFHERDVSLPRGAVAKFVQGCASRTLVLSEAHQVNAHGASAAGLLARTEAPSLHRLERDLVALRRDSGLPPSGSRLAILRSLQRALNPQPPPQGDSPAGPWIEQTVETLELEAIAASHPDQENVVGLPELVALVRSRGLAMQDLAARVEVIGKVVLTTYHSAKGREFASVVLPGLVNGLVPRDVNDKGQWRKASGRELEEQRRAFYVAVSRASESVFLIVGPGHHTQTGYWISKGPSDFVVDMAARLE